MRLSTTTMMFSALFAVSLEAQQPTQAQCDSAQASVTAQPLPPQGSSAWGSWATLHYCGNQGAVTLAQVLQAPAVLSASDAMALAHLFHFFGGVRSPDLYNAYIAVAQSATASPQVRVDAIEALGNQSRPLLGFMADDYLNPSLTICRATYPATDSSSTGAPMPAGFQSSIYSTMKAIEATAGAPTVVRGAAHCWRVSLAKYEPLDTTTITLTYVCQNLFRIMNPNINSYTFTYQSVGANVLMSEKGSITALGFGVTPLSMLYPSTVRLFYNGTQIQSKPNGHTACP